VGSNKKRVDAKAGGKGPDFSAFRALLQDKVTSSSVSWEGVVDVLRKDDRFGDHGEKSTMEKKRDLFEEHRKKLEKVEGLRKMNENRVERDIQAGKQRQMESLRREALLHYSTLLSEMVRDSTDTFDVAVKQLKADPQRRASNDMLNESTMRDMFEAHVMKLRSESKEKLVAMFAAQSLCPGRPWAEVWADLKDEDDFLDYPEDLWREAWSKYAEEHKSTNDENPAATGSMDDGPKGALS